jgi:hypothetical protein
MWSEPVEVQQPWGHMPALLAAWHDGFVGIDIADEGAAAGTVVATSPNLVDWTVLARGRDVPFTVDSGKLLATADRLIVIEPVTSTPSLVDLRMWASTDGASWSSFGPKPGPKEWLRDVAAGPAGLLVLASGGWHKPIIWRSKTGATWSKVDLSAAGFNTADVTGVLAVPDGFLASGGAVGGFPPTAVGDPGGSPAAWWSNDGLKWTAAPVESDQGAMYIEPGLVMAHGYLAEGWRTGFWTSRDGHKWTSAARSELSNQIWSLAADGNRCVGFDIAALYQTDQTDAGQTPRSFSAWVTADGVAWRSLTMSGTDLLTWISVDWGAPIVAADGVYLSGFITGTNRTLVIHGVATA